MSIFIIIFFLILQHNNSKIIITSPQTLAPLFHPLEGAVARRDILLGFTEVVIRDNGAKFLFLVDSSSAALSPSCDSESKYTHFLFYLHLQVAFPFSSNFLASSEMSKMSLTTVT